MPPGQGLPASASDKHLSQSKLSHELSQPAPSNPKRHRSLSLGGRLKNFLPSNRPERGSTIREGGFWEELEAKDESTGFQAPLHQATESLQHSRSGTVDSDRIVRWNTPKPLPDKPKEARSLHKRIGSEIVGSFSSLNANRKWSWSPKDERFPLKFAKRAQVDKDEATAAMNSQHLSNPNAFQAASQMAQRRLSYARQVIEAKKESRRQRRDLKESGDYLGPQGINPDTGQLDVVTPSDSDQSALGTDSIQQIDKLKQIIENSPSDHKATRARAEQEIQKIISREEQKLLKAEKEKEALQKVHNTVRWRRQTKQWSSAQEPNLSPVVSQRNMSLPSRSITPDDDMAVNQMASDKEELIDISSPEETGGELMTLMRYKGTSKNHSGSSGTIVRTPHEPRVVALNPGAQELFENGISFETLDQSVGDSGLNSHIFVDSHVKNNTHLTKAREDSPSPRHIRGASYPTFPTAGPRDTSSTTDGKRATFYHPFLGKSHQRVIEPGGLRRRARMRVMKPRTQQAWEDDDDDDPYLTTTSRVSALPQEQDEEKHVDFERGLTHISKKYPTPKMSPESRFPPAPDQSQSSSECDLDFLLQSLTDSEDEKSLWTLLRAKKPEHHYQNVARKPVIGETSMPDHPQVMTGPKRNPQTWAPVTKEEIQGDMNNLKGKLALIDQPHSASFMDRIMDRKPDRVVSGPAEELGAMATDKDKDVVAESACTRTTTITGSDLLVSTLSHLAAMSPPADQDQERRLDRLIYDRVNESTSPGDLTTSTTSPMSHMLSALPNPKPKEETPASDITSVRHLRATKKRTMQLAPGLTDNPQPVPGFRRHSISHTSTFTADRQENLDPVPARRQTWYLLNLDPEESFVQKRVEVYPVPHEVRPSAPRSFPTTTTKLPQSNGQATREQGPQPLMAVLAETGKLTVKATRDLAVRIPGSYPTHLDADDDIAGRSKREPTQRKQPEPKIVSFWTATENMPKAVKNKALKFLSLYWATIKPVFNAESHFWQRNARHQSTWGDCMSLAMAVPVALVALTVLV